jgi:hypothetical protein
MIKRTRHVSMKWLDCYIQFVSWNFQNSGVKYRQLLEDFVSLCWVRKEKIILN